jgi:serine/threonine protein kinase
VHRDIKPSNLLIAGDSNKVVLKIGDFGEVKIIEQSKMMDSVRGTQSYWAPEMHSLSVSNTQLSYNKSVDVFAKGMSDLALLDCGDKQLMKAKKCK